jgi:hypothetical protein
MRPGFEVGNLKERYYWKNWILHFKRTACMNLTQDLKSNGLL